MLHRPRQTQRATLLFTLRILHLFLCRRCRLPSGEHPPLRSCFCPAGQLHLHPLLRVSVLHTHHLLLLICPRRTAGQVDRGVRWGGDADLGGAGSQGEGQRCVHGSCGIAQPLVLFRRRVTVAGRFALQ